MMRKKKRLLTPIVTVLLLMTIIASAFTTVLSANASVYYGNSPYISENKGNVSVNKSDYFDPSRIYKLADGILPTDDISLIIETPGITVLGKYEEKETNVDFTEYVRSKEASAVRKNIEERTEKYLAALDKAGIEYSEGVRYSTLISGFEIIVKARDYAKVCGTLGNECGIFVGDSYSRAETELVENDVNVYETGIFNSSGFGYDGTGMVVAVLDTGLDYYHTAFSVNNFTADRGKLGLTFSELEKILADKELSAESSTGGLTASDLYINEKVPFGYDYADKDSEVFPIRQDHGTHVAGIIAGKDDTITGVAPNAQLAIMKIFSDLDDSARASWIIAALEDCVNLGVDVINMSIGTSCGFSTPSDKELESRVYEKIDEMGMSLIVAASNSFNSAYGSEKNGNLPLTSNPDSATIGSPATYEGALSVGSISGVKTPYILFGGKIIYFTESTDKISEEKHFVDELLSSNQTETEIEFIKIPGVGRRADYTGIDIKGKIALISRGDTTFEEKANVAEVMGAAGVIIYNNVSGEIKMNVGETAIPVCSISQDAGEILAAQGTGTIKVSRNQTSGPFMSDFSSWGPGPDLEIKPEITAHGGSILSAIPGQDYDRISGTSMATPNVSGLAALLRQYVIENFPDEMTKDENGEVSLKKVTAVINRLMMSTADIVYNQNGLPYSVRKQGAGLANLFNSAATGAYILTYDREDGSVMDKSKIELGDDPSKTGVYTLRFSIDNFGKTSVSYDLSAYVMTEGVSDTKTHKGDTTVTEAAYILSGATITVSGVDGGTQNGNNITVAAGETAHITVTVKLGDADKKYLDDSFKNGMYVEGFVTLKATSDKTVNLSVPYLAFYGDWTQAPLFDLTYFETNKDEIDDAIDLFDKTLADAYATRPIGGIYSDYVSELGSYYYEQKPGTNKIAADGKYVSLSNQEDTVNSFRFIWGGLLRNAAKIRVSITDDATGEEVYSVTENNIRKSYGDGGPIYPANIDVEFSAIEQNLKNNTQYTVTVTGLLDYGDGGVDTNANNSFSFPLYVDFEAPAVTGCEFYTEYDRSEKKTKLFAKVAVYDNHYSMAMLFGYNKISDEDINGDGVLNDVAMVGFDKYLTPIYSSFNDECYVVYELTDYIDEIKENSLSPNTITVCTYDYALNQAIYDIGLPDEFTDLYFEEETITLSPNEVYKLAPKIYPGSEWSELLTYTSANNKVVRVVGNELIAVGSGITKVKADALDENGAVVKSTIVTVKVLSPNEDGYRELTAPAVKEFALTGFFVNKAYYFISTEERDIGKTGDTVQFVGKNFSLSMFPSESVTIESRLVDYFGDTTIAYESSNPSIVDVDSHGRVTAKSEGYASITARVLKAGKSTYYSETITVEVKDPYVTLGPSLSHYYGNGGKVIIPTTLGVTDIAQFAFSNFDYVQKTASDIINDENPEFTKPWYIGDDTIEEVVIPEGVETIGSYAFAGLSELERVVLPSTIKKIEVGAFYNCTKLKEVVGIEKVQFFNQNAFANTALTSIKLDNAIAIADYAFVSGDVAVEYDEATETYVNLPVTKALTSVTLSEKTQSIGAYAFAGNSKLKTLSFSAAKLKIGQFAFMGCSSLESVSVNAAVIPTGAFYSCHSLKSVTIGKDVAVIGEYAFGNTSVAEFAVAEGNETFKSATAAKYLLSSDGSTILLASPTLTELTVTDTKITAIGNGAFSGNGKLTSIIAPSVIRVADYAFSECKSLASVSFGNLTSVGNYAFFNTDISAFDFSTLSEIGEYAFGMTDFTTVSIANGTYVGKYAFSECDKLATVIIGNNVTLADGAFAYSLNRDKYDYHYELVDDKHVAWFIYTSPLTSLTIGDGVSLGDSAFFGAAKLVSVTLGKGAAIGDSAFYNCASLTDIDLSKAVSIGANAFYGDYFNKFYDQDLSDGYSESSIVYDDDGMPVYVYNSAKLATVDLSSLSELGDQAFAYNRALTSVKLGDGLVTIPYGAFYECNNLSSVNLGKVEVIGDYAFNATAISELELPATVTIGKFAFLSVEELTDVTFGDGIDSVGEGAFSYCGQLATVNGMNGIKIIGNYAFAYTAITSADITSAISLGDHAFMKEHRTDFTVKFGDALSSIGENPFAYCNLKPLTSEIIKDTFNGTDYKETVSTFDITDTVKVIDGSIYRVVPNGLEFVAYCGEGGSFTVADNTVRLSALSFAGSDVTGVVLPYTLHSIGHKAFFDCEKLLVVNFASYDAPVLEEEYDFYLFFEGNNIPASGEGGLGIIPYFMWNVTSWPTNTYYGANFVDYVGCVENKLIMVRPSNGKNYDSFIFGHYFSTVIDGAPAADSITLEAIEAISKLPEKVSLADEALVIAARNAYNKVGTNEQKALVTEYDKLVQAEKRIADLKYLAESDKPTEPDVPTNPEPPVDDPVDDDKVNTGTVILIVVLSVLGAAALAAGAYFGLRYFKTRSKK